MIKDRNRSPAARASRGYLFLSIVGISLLILSGWHSHQRIKQALLEKQRETLQAEAERLVSVISRERLDLRDQMIALAEQRSTREGVAHLTGRSKNRSWDEGFLLGMDATCRALAVGNQYMLSLALRDAEGNRLAGLGGQQDSVISPEFPERHQMVVKEFKRGMQPIEKWIVPVRDIDATPLQFLVADVSFFGSDRIFESLIKVDEAFSGCIWNTGGEKLHYFGPLFASMESIPDTSFIAHDGRSYDLIHSYVPVSEWELSLALDRSNVHDEIKAVRGRTINTTIFYGVLLLCVGIGLVTRHRRNQGERPAES